jgi:YrbI family 3-deoxy-D-manno-octulosonate 8-phosphate phosphatase
MNLNNLCRPVELILSDVDGVLTDGGIWYDNQGVELKGFHIHDGMGIRLWQRAGFKFGVMTARTSHIVKLRGGELGLDFIRQGIEDKLGVATEIMRECRLAPNQVCYIGDDLPDLPVIRHVGVGIAVADAAAEVRTAAAYVTRAAGGRGAAREVVEMILKAKSRWEDVVQGYLR